MNKLRIAYYATQEMAGFTDLAVTPQALVYISSEYKGKFLKPLDFLTREDICNTKQWVVETVMAMDSEWRKYGTTLPEFIKTIGLDLCVLLETIKVADIVLTKIWNTNNFTQICIDSYKMSSNNMIEYEFPGYEYTELLNDSLWIDGKKIKVVNNQMPFTDLNYGNANVFSPPLWKKIIKKILSLYRVSRQMQVNLFSIFFIKKGLYRHPAPSLFVVPNKDNSEVLQYPCSVILNDYLAILPEEPKKIKDLQTELICSLESWFSNNTPVMENIRLYKNIVRSRLTDFVRARKDLVTAYIKIQSMQNVNSLKMILPSSIGCATDAWCSMAIQEKGGVVSSGQHGGGHNSYQPYLIFSEARFSYFFTYGEISPTYEFFQKHGKATIVKTGSPVFYKIQQKCGAPPQRVKRILYIMNLCVPFYSANFPWEFVLKQFQVLELLNLYTDKYTIHIKEEQTGTVKRSNYKGLNFMRDNPKDVLHKYDMLIVESGISTAVLEATVTNKYIVAFTGAEWEDSSKESLDMLSKRAECFHTYDDFLAGLGKILDDPRKNLDPSKLTSLDFMNTYCNPVSPEHYIETIKNTLKLP